MTTKLYANLGKGGADGTTATNLLLSAGGDNPLILGGATGWAFEADDISPDGPPDGHGFRRATTGVASYLRSEFAPTGDRSGGAAWFYVPATQTAEWHFMRLVNATEQAVVQLSRRTTGSVWLSIISTVDVNSQSSPLAAGWYRFEILYNHVAQTAEYRIINSSGTQVFTWSGAAATGRGPVTGVRYGEPSSAAHGVNPVRIGSRVVWGSLDSGWFPRNVAPFSDAPEPPPPTSAVSHYNTAEGLTVGAALTAGVGSGSDGIKMSARAGEVGTTIEVTAAAINGTRAYVVKGGTDQAYTQWGLNSRSLASRMHLKAAATPSATTRVMVHRNAHEEPVANLLLTSGSQVLLQAGRGTIVSQTLPGVVDYSRAIRLELWTDVDNDEVHAAWGYEDSGNEGEVTVSAALGDVQLGLVQYGKLLSTLWSADFVIDDLAANIRAAGFIGGYAETYTMIATVAADIVNLEPGETFELEAITGTGTWAQASGADANLIDAGTAAWGTAPYTLAGETLVFTYGDAEQKVTVLRATERYVGPGGVEVPLEVRVGLDPPEIL